MFAQQAGQSHVLMLASAGLAYVYSSQGKLQRAFAVCQDAIEIADKFRLRTNRLFTAAACVYAELSNILVQWGKTEPALQAARKGLALGELWGQTDTIVLCLLNLIKGFSFALETETAKFYIERARKIAQKVSAWFMLFVNDFEVRLWLNTSDTARINSISPHAFNKLRLSTQARLLFQRNQLDEALYLVDQNLPAVLNTSSLDAVRLGIVKSLVLYKKGDKPAAITALKWSLEQSIPENYVAAFVCEGERMEALLRLALSQNINREYVRQLLSAFEARRGQAPTPIVEPLIEPLSEREKEVLHMLDGPLAAVDIAEQLFVSTHTIRTHIKNIYFKLGVHGRSGAVKRARELGLLG